MKKKLLTVFKIVFGLYALLCGFLYFFQESIIFFPQKLNKDHQFNFNQKFKELNIKTYDNKIINGLLFKAKNTKGLIFYLHGNAGSLDSWGTVAKNYTKLNYDVFILDYRGFGKSEGSIKNQEQVFKDNQTAYNLLKKEYNEQNIIILGYSIGTGMASKLASENTPKELILQAPYYNLTDIMRRKFSLIPTFILKYKFETNKYLKKCKMPITIFHGKEDRVISYNSSLKLKKDFPKINLITLFKQGHNRISYNKVYNQKLKILLNK